ncbi:hypothetical protein YC2023_051619 [Brassica napus]
MLVLLQHPPRRTTWLKALTVTLPERSKNHPSSDVDHLLLYENPHGIVPDLEIKVYHESSSPKLDKFSATPRLFSTHMRLHAMQENLRHFPCKIVYVCRNVKDTLISSTTWLKALTVTLPERSKNHPSSDADHLLLYENPHGIVPALEIKVYHESSSPNLDKFSATPRLFSTHMRLHAMQENLRHFPCKIVSLPRKKGRLYGVGSLSTSLGSVSASFPSSSIEEPSLKKIIKDQALFIQSQGNEIVKLNAVVRYLAGKDSTVADILQSEDVSHGSRDDDESDAI